LDQKKRKAKTDNAEDEKERTVVNLREGRCESDPDKY
jgi:hypothetical protein